MLVIWVGVEVWAVIGTELLATLGLRLSRLTLWGNGCCTGAGLVATVGLRLYCLPKDGNSHLLLAGA